MGNGGKHKGGMMKSSLPPLQKMPGKWRAAPRDDSLAFDPVPCLYLQHNLISILLDRDRQALAEAGQQYRDQGLLGPLHGGISMAGLMSFLLWVLASKKGS